MTHGKGWGLSNFQRTTDTFLIEINLSIYTILVISFSFMKISVTCYSNIRAVIRDILPFYFSEGPPRASRTFPRVVVFRRAPMVYRCVDGTNLWSFSIMRQGNHIVCLPSSSKDLSSGHVVTMSIVEIGGAKKSIVYAVGSLYLM